MRPTNLSFITAIDPVIEVSNFSFSNLLARALVSNPPTQACIEAAAIKFSKEFLPSPIHRAKSEVARLTSECSC